jgi:hypothetical protein
MKVSFLSALVVVTSATGCFALSSRTFAPSRSLQEQTQDQQADRALRDGSQEVMRTAATQADRFETDHLILYIDKGLMASDAEREFSTRMEHYFLATSEFLGRRFDSGARRTAKPTYYLTNRAGISHAQATTIFLRAERVVPAPAIAIHETVHLLLMSNPAAPRNRTDLTPEEDERLTSITGAWLAEGFAGYVSYELAPRLGVAPDHLFAKGDRTTVDAEAREWMRDPRGAYVLPFVGLEGLPSGFLADRVNVAPPFYVLAQSFTKYLVEHASLRMVIRLYEEHFNGTGSIRDDVNRLTGKDLARWREEWLHALETEATNR